MTDLCMQTHSPKELCVLDTNPSPTRWLGQGHGSMSLMGSTLFVEVGKSSGIHRAPAGSDVMHYFISQCQAPVPVLHGLTWNFRSGTGEIQLGSSQLFRWVLPCQLAAAVQLRWVLTSAGAATIPTVSASCWNAGQQHIVLIGSHISFQIVLILCLNVQQRILQCWLQRTWFSCPAASLRAHSKVRALPFPALPGR